MCREHNKYNICCLEYFHRHQFQLLLNVRSCIKFITNPKELMEHLALYVLHTFSMTYA